MEGILMRRKSLQNCYAVIILCILCFALLIGFALPTTAAENRPVEVKPKEAAQSAEHRIALVIGNTNYRVEALQNPDAAENVHVEADSAKTTSIVMEKPAPPSVVKNKIGDAYRDSTTGMEFIFVKGGCYEMGDTFGDGEKNEKPVHNVCVNDFYLGQYEATVGQFKQFVSETGYETEAEKGDGCSVWDGSQFGKDGSKSWRSPGFSRDGADDNQPVVCVTWSDTQAFAEWLSRKGGKSYRLPTEAEWEYAARSGGKKEKFAGMSNESGLGDYAWYNANSGNKTHSVGGKRPNGLGLYDMTGNVFEWCQDWYGEKYYAERPRNNPRGPSSGKYRVLRGGCWLTIPEYARATFRFRGLPANRDSDFGFRLSFSAPR